MGSKSLEDWKHAIRMGIRYRQVYGKSKDWQVYKNYYRGFFKAGTVPVNIIYAIGRSLIPQVYFRDPRVSIIPLKPGYTMHGRVVERIDNLMIRAMNIKNEMKSMALDCYLTGRGPGILGYDSEYGFDPQNVQEIKNEGDMESDPTDIEKKIEYNYNVNPGMPWFLRCSPNDFIVPWGSRSMKEAPWFAFRKMRMLKDIKADPKYSNTKNLAAPYRSRLESSDKDRQTTTQQEDFKAEWVEIWQIHDQQTGTVKVLSLDHDKFLRDDDDELQVHGLPAHVLGFNEDPDYFWWTPDCRLIEQQQLEINDIRTMAKQHRRVALLKVLYDKGMIKGEELAKLMDESPKVMVGIDAALAGGDIRKAVQLFQSHVPPDLAAAAKEVREDIREIIGFSRNQMGAFEESSGRRTAHEAEIVRAASMIRIDERRDIMADMLTDIVQGSNELIFSFWNAERVIDIIGPDGARYWVKFTGPEIKGNFAYKVNPEESQPSNRQVEIQQIEQFIGLAKEVPGMDIKYLVESFASRFDWVDPKLLFPANSAGRNPDRPMMFNDFNAMMQGKGVGPMAGLSQQAQQMGSQ